MRRWRGNTSYSTQSSPKPALNLFFATCFKRSETKQEFGVKLIWYATVKSAHSCDSKFARIDFDRSCNSNHSCQIVIQSHWRAYNLILNKFGTTQAFQESKLRFLITTELVVISKAL